MSELTLHAIDVDLERNILRLRLAEHEDGDITGESAEATIDIGTSGRLIGVELGERYIDVMPAEPGTEHLIRSADATVRIERDAQQGSPISLEIPRLGAGYEITWPSGNQ